MVFKDLDYRLALRSLKIDTFYVQIDVTEKCNLHCTHCYAANRNQYESNDWESTISTFNNFCKRFRLKPCFIICGGEPFVSSSTFVLVELIRKNWPNNQIIIATNGTIISNNLIRLLQKNNIRLQISLDGPEETSHDKIRGTGAFNKTIQNIEKFIQNNIPVSLQAVLSSTSAKQISDFFSIASSLNVNSMNFTRLIPIGGAENDDNCLTSAELLKSYSEIAEQSAIKSINTALRKPLAHFVNSSYSSFPLFGYNSAVITPHHDLLVSSRSGIKLGNLDKSSFTKIFLENPLLKSLRSGDIQGCKDCTHFFSCGGDRNAAYAETGSYLDKDPLCPC